MPLSRFLRTCIALAILVAAAPASADDKESCAVAAERAQKLRSEKKFRAAKEKIIACSRQSCPAFIRNDCVKWLADVDAALPTVIVRVRDPKDKDVIDVKVTVDGEPFAGMLDGTAHAVDPGRHTFRYEATGWQPVEEEILISQGEKDRVLKVMLKSEAVGTGPSSSPKTTPDTTTDQAPPPEQDTGSKPSIAPWIVGGIGVAGLVAFGIFETTGQLGYASLKDGCGATPQKCTPGDVDAVRAQLAVAIVGLIVGGIGIGTAATMLLLRGSGSSKAAAAARHLTVAPTAGGVFGSVVTTF